VLSFVSTYCCEAAVLKCTLIKKKQRSRLDPEADVWVLLSISNLTSKMDLWKASTSVSFVTCPVQWRE
jgi:hypothetical protein